jgi:hypothetical protein
LEESSLLLPPTTLAYSHSLGDRSQRDQNMRSASSVRVSKMLITWDHSDQAGRDGLISSVYDELSSLARRYPRRECPNLTLRSGAHVRKAAVRLVFQDPPQSRNRAQLFGLAAERKQRVLVDHL